MREAAFCYLGLLKGRERLEPVLALLAEPGQRVVRGLLDEAAALEPAEWKNRLRSLRQSEAQAAWRAARDRWGGGLEGAPPWLRRAACEFLRGSHGREDHQG